MNRRILVIDDENDILEVLELVLREEGFEVETASNADSIFSKIEEFHPNLILLDVFLGPHDGRKVCSIIKTNNKTRDIPVIMLSAYSSLSGSIKEVGAEDFIPKPFSIYTLMDHIQRQISA